MARYAYDFVYNAPREQPRYRVEHGGASRAIAAFRQAYDREMFLGHRRGMMTNQENHGRGWLHGYDRGFGGGYDRGFRGHEAPRLTGMESNRMRGVYGTDFREIMRRPDARDHGYDRDMRGERGDGMNSGRWMG